MRNIEQGPAGHEIDYNEFTKELLSLPSIQSVESINKTEFLLTLKNGRVYKISEEAPEVQKDKKWISSLNETFEKKRDSLVGLLKSKFTDQSIYPLKHEDLVHMAYIKVFNYLSRPGDEGERVLKNAEALLKMAVNHVAQDHIRDEKRKGATVGYVEGYSDEDLYLYGGIDSIPMKGEILVDRNQLYRDLLDEDGRVITRFQKTKETRDIVGWYLEGYQIEEVAKLYLEKYGGKEKYSEEEIGKARVVVEKTFTRARKRAAELYKYDNLIS